MSKNTLYSRAYKRKNPEKVREIHHRCYLAAKAKHEAILDETLGVVCVVCGFSDTRALCVDHLYNDGAIHRQKIGNDRFRLAKDVLANPERFQRLCYNCNRIKQVQANPSNKQIALK